MIPIIHNGKYYTDQIKAIRISKDGALAGIVLKSSEILIYRVTSLSIYLHVVA